MQKASGVVTDNVSLSCIGDENGSIDEDVKLSDIEFDTVSIGESLNQNKNLQSLIDANFRDDEWKHLKSPFPHWTVNR